MNEQFNTRLPQISHDQVDQIAAAYGMTKTQVLILALDRLARDLYPPTSPNTAKEEAILIAQAGDSPGCIEQK